MVPDVVLNNDIRMPALGFGVYKIPEEQVEGAVHTAVEAGYRSIDTATLYRNERGVGNAVRSSGLPREELFVTTKLWNSDHGYDRALAAFDESMERLALDYVDLYLIHWPVPSQDRYVETWRALAKILADGRARAVGVSNFEPEHLRRIIDETGVVPVVNQVELHPNLPQERVRAFDAEHGIVTESWSPLARGRLLENETLTRLAHEHGKTAAQIVLRWHLQLGLVAIPKSVTPERIRANIDIFDFELAEAEMAAISGLASGSRTGMHPNDG
jgi:2,5-diketo-D-gluconate reductase A